MSRGFSDLKLVTTPGTDVVEHPSTSRIADVERCHPGHAVDVHATECVHGLRSTRELARCVDLAGSRFVEGDDERVLHFEDGQGVEPEYPDSGLQTVSGLSLCVLLPEAFRHRRW